MVGLVGLTMFSCVDSDYDLSDIDTTASFKANSLVVPIQIDQITLDQVLDLGEESEIVKTKDPDGNIIYALRKSGSFVSENIVVDPFVIPVPDINSTKVTLSFSKEGDTKSYYDIQGSNSLQMPFKSPETAFDPSICKMEWMGVETTYTTTIQLQGLSQQALSNTTVTGLQIQYPEGMTGIPEQGTYSTETGILDLSGVVLRPDSQGAVTIKMQVTGIDCTDEHVTVDYDRHVATYEGSIKILSGRVNVDASGKEAKNITLKTDHHLDSIRVSHFSGELKYEFADFNIEPVYINSLPDLLSQKGTQLHIDNPQIYLTVTNPLYEYNVHFRTSFTITATRGGFSKTYSPDSPYIETQSDDAADNEFLLSPQLPSAYIEGYSHPQHVPFTSLSHLFGEVEGIPEMLDIEAPDPMMPRQDVDDYQLGEDYGPVKGEYTLFAPLSLTDQSVVVYADTIDGWNDEEVDALTINKVVFSFDASTEVPLEIELTILPIDTTGQVIAGVKSDQVKVPAHAKDVPVELTVEGTINHLDGMIVQSRVIGQDSDSPLAPDMTLYMKNSKATLTGVYEKEL